MKTDAKPIHDESLELFFDGECPLCAREVSMLMRLDKDARIVFTDIAAPGFRAPEGLDYATLMERIHARRGGKWYEGVEVFRQLYAEVGFGAAVSLSRLPGINGALEFGYRRFAQNRLKLTGRCDDTCVVAEAAS
jgi:predicted DCC family thiol-disulfide oxidoreductase YuxK